MVGEKRIFWVNDVKLFNKYGKQQHKNTEIHDREKRHLALFVRHTTIRHYICIDIPTRGIYADNRSVVALEQAHIHSHTVFCRFRDSDSKQVLFQEYTPEEVTDNKGYAYMDSRRTRANIHKSDDNSHVDKCR